MLCFRHFYCCWSLLGRPTILNALSSKPTTQPETGQVKLKFCPRASHGRGICRGPSTLVGICTQHGGWEGKQRERRGKHIGRVRSLPYFDYICLAQVHGLVDCSWPVERDSKLWGHRSAPVWNSRASMECGMYFQHFEHFVPW